MKDIQALTHNVKKEAKRLGFHLVGVTTPEPPEHIKFFLDWCQAGYQGKMDWMATDRAKSHRADPQKVLPECESILVLGSPYPSPSSEGNGGKIAAYAGNQDYHDVLGERLEALILFIEGEYGEPFPHCWYTDTGPILERDLAQRAGLGWIGKNTTLINQAYGSYFFLAEIFLGIKLITDSPFTGSFCGACTRCLEACPTGSLVEPYTLDARLCVSYLTIENRDSIPVELRPLQGEWIFGCDICQEVCPWNQKINRAEAILPEFQSRPDLPELDLRAELALSQEEFKEKFKDSPINRAKRQGYLRNIAVVLGNQGSEDVVPDLAQLLQDPEPILRGHAAWALGKIGGETSRQALVHASKLEKDPSVMEEIQGVLKNLKGATDS